MPEIGDTAYDFTIEVSKLFFTGQRDQQFFQLLMEAARNVAATAREFSDLSSDLAQARERSTYFKDLERKGDRYTHDLITLLNKLFVTPFDREDILALTVKIDDLVDGLEAAVSRVGIYRIEGHDRFVSEFAAIIQSQAEEIVLSMHRLQGKELLKIRENTVQINILENQADDLLREALGRLFDNETDPVRILKLKEVYETLETVTDRAEDVANILESVVMKNA